MVYVWYIPVSKIRNKSLIQKRNDPFLTHVKQFVQYEYKKKGENGIFAEELD